MEVSTIIVVLLAILIFIIALLYSTVGHAGASGYIAAMALFGMAPMVMKPTALTLNIIVALIGTVRFSRVGFFSWRTFWPFAITSIPAAYIGGSLTLPVLLLMHWAKTKETSGVSAAFILVNSIAGLLGHIPAITYLSGDLIYWAPAALVGGWIGTELGTRLLPISGIRKFLSVVLVLAGLKLISESVLILLGR